MSFELLSIVFMIGNGVSPLLIVLKLTEELCFRTGEPTAKPGPDV